MKAKDIMHKRVVTVSPNMTLREVAQILSENNITGAPVASGTGGVIGVISQTDIVRNDRRSAPASVPYYHMEPEEGLRARGFHMEIPDYTRVEQVMTPWAVSYEEDTPIKVLARQMLKKHIHRVVITREGRLCGIVTSMDMLRALLAMTEKPASRVRTHGNGA